MFLRASPGARGRQAGTRGHEPGQPASGADPRAALSGGTFRARGPRRARRRIRTGRERRDAARRGHPKRWAASLREIDSAIRGEEDGAAYPVRADRLAVVVLDRLVGRRARGALRGAAPAARPRGRSRHALVPRPAPAAREVGRGRWRERARGPAAWVLGRRYRRALDELEREGNHAAGPLVEAYEEPRMRASR